MAMKLPQTLIGVGTLALAAVLAAGATQISSEAGYSGVGPELRALAGWLWRWRCAAAFWSGNRVSGGFREMEEPSGAEHGHWPGFGWVSAGMLLNALLITRIGFILSCTLCFVLAVRGFKAARRARLDLVCRKRVAKDALIGACIAAPVYWMFTKAAGDQPAGPHRHRLALSKI